MLGSLEYSPVHLHNIRGVYNAVRCSHAIAKNTFCKNTSSMVVFLVKGYKWSFMKYLFLLVVLYAGSIAQTVKDTSLVMSDGVAIAMRYYVPLTVAPASGYPAVVLVHGYGGSLLNMDAAARLYSKNGYVVTAYTVRGQGTGKGTAESGGAFSWFWGARELQDCNAVIEWTRRHLNVNSERVGMEGYSQGGLTSWGAAIQHFNIRCAVPVISCPRLWQCVTRNNCHNHFMVTAMALTKSGLIVRPTGFIRDTLTPRTEQDDIQGVINALKTYNMDSGIEQVSIPMYMQCGWQDDLFPGDEVMKAFHTLNSPKKLFLWAAGHDLPPDSATLAIKHSNTLRFYDYWLKDNINETIMSADSVVCVQDGATRTLRYHSLQDSVRYMGTANAPKALRFYFSPNNKISTVAPTQNTLYAKPYIQNLTTGAEAQLLFRTAKVDEDITFCAARTSLLVNSTGRKFQANVMLYDYDSVANRYYAITRGSYHVRLGASDTVAKRRRISYDLSPQLYTIKQGHYIVAAVRFGTQVTPITFARETNDFGHVPFPPQETVTDTLLCIADNPSWLELLPYTQTTTRVEEEDVHQMPTITTSSGSIECATPFTTNATVDILTITGATLQTFVVDDATIVRCSLQHQPNGVYFIRVHQGSREFVQRVVLAR